ncbi:MAG: UDP-N-acetylenolpyruvoylglucosamine reductase [Candidatus Yanofskybacteria bacterium RIFCSPLOWO2_01_FULL_41_34]|uniref:UDP-N-acetylenolpyruvoylglucosamine reductase n=1 Tax=Candidatus Yanofskybacteria bacterium RIFCSPHIGHO2_01_FULL_41_26 TaxID=1802661 RepID=A0A1F8EG31_9BACT|nr:MAG: UDP-N-acetylenolpyruvoylglucosamine reductase [Candidatus Yanofskybacteria bacterium RIFCSPHIGHO2_01_FULL_41_26]OGN20921.1 MAG: UDP-N-acetylenolpyruvoylglucosamine reductase [Candidatus Yanofskybacteria bacterium RIFCSPLOWO2_01_FULL_41_34]
MIIKENVILAPYTTFKIGGPARYFCEVGNIIEFREALKFSKENNLRFFILGGGSNILFSGKGFSGLVIKMEIKGLKFKDDKDYSILIAGAGESWDDVVEKAVERNLGGIENLSLIPGTAGGAVCQNIGAYGVELKDVLLGVEVFDAKSGGIKTFFNKDCHFGYRDSVFKNRDDLVILKVDLKLLKNLEPNIKYPDLVKFFENVTPSIVGVRQAVINIRKKKLPYPSEVGNAGSFFKNPIIEMSGYQFLISKHSDLKGYDMGSGWVKLLAGQLIEKCGWKGKQLGNVGVSDKHSLVLVNYGNGTAEEVIHFSEEIKRSVKDRFGIELEPEVEVVDN